MYCKTKLRLSLIFEISTLLFCLCASQQLHAQTTSGTSAPATEKIEVTVTAGIEDELAGTGKYAFSADTVSRLKTGDYNLNAITRTLPNVQFNQNIRAANTFDLLNLRPENISISGGRFYENNFMLNGISTSSVRAMGNTTNIYDAFDVAGSPQTVIPNPALVGQLTIYESDVPARLGGFTGGVVEAEMKRPAGKPGGSYGFYYDNDSLTTYIPFRLNGEALPSKPDFWGAYHDAEVHLPAIGKLNLMLAWSYGEKQLTNTPRDSFFGSEPATSKTQVSNYALSADYLFSNNNRLEFTTLYAPYEQTSHSESSSSQHNDGWSNTLKWKHSASNYNITVTAGYNKTNFDRDSDPNFYAYLNVEGYPYWGDGLSCIGGYGNLVSRQDDIPLRVEFDYNFTRSLKLNAGVEYTHTRAREARPQATYLYQSVAFEPDPLATSASGPGDLTVIEGSQAVELRTEYPAFDTTVTLNKAAAWASLSDNGKWGSVEWLWRAGLRFDYDDVFKNSNVAPRVTGILRPLSWLYIKGGINRYYSGGMLAYKLNENYPYNRETYRTWNDENGKHVYYNDESEKGWTGEYESAFFNRRQGDNKTPYSDEYSAALTFQTGVAGDLTILGLIRHARDEFAASGPVYDTRPDGSELQYYLLTNDAWTDYRSLSFKWEWRWKNNRFTANGTLSETDDSQNDTYHNQLQDIAWWDEAVYYHGKIQKRADVDQSRKNYSDPHYINFTWSSDWFDKRLLVDVTGKWRGNYDSIRKASETYVGEDGAEYTMYVDYAVHSSFDIDLNVALVVARTRYGNLQFEARVDNLLNEAVHESDLVPTASYYETGRAVRLGMRYMF